MTEAGILIGAPDFWGRASENFKNSKKKFFKKISKFRLQSFFGLGEDYMSRKFERPSSKTVGGDRFLKSYLEINVLMFNLLVAQTPDTCVDKMVTLWL